MPLKILYHPAIIKDLKPIPKKDKEKIKNAIEKKIAVDPLFFGQPLKGSLKPFFKFRVGKYRIIFDLVGKEIHILIISHRKKVYEEAQKRK
jgi:mRNA interferase RelE/StbE